MFGPPPIAAAAVREVDGEAFPELSFIGSTPSTTNQQTHTFTNHNIGAAAGDRLVIVVACFNQSNSSSVTCTIGGVAATKVRQDANGGLAGCAIFYRNVPSGTSADIVVTTASGSINTLRIGVWRLVGQSSDIPADDNGTNGVNSVLSANIDVPARAVMVAGFHVAAGGSCTWSNATERFDNTDNNLLGTGADHTNATDSDQDGRTITATATASQRAGLSIASWR